MRRWASGASAILLAAGTSVIRPAPDLDRAVAVARRPAAAAPTVAALVT